MALAESHRAAEVYKLADSADPVKDMLATLGDLRRVEVGGARVLVWLFIRPSKSKGGILLTDAAKKEDVWQAAVGYVLKLGPLAFTDDPDQNIKFGGFRADVGDWVTFRIGEGKRIQINGIDCALFEDATIMTKVADPMLITHRQ